jgi:hypothetical protein
MEKIGNHSILGDGYSVRKSIKLIGSNIPEISSEKPQSSESFSNLFCLVGGTIDEYSLNLNFR